MWFNWKRNRGRDSDTVESLLKTETIQLFKQESFKFQDVSYALILLLINVLSIGELNYNHQSSYCPDFDNYILKNYQPMSFLTVYL